MNVLPFELLGAVAGELDSLRDLTHFRLVNHACAAAALPLLAQHIAVLNITESLEELCSFLQSHANFARHVVHLSVYHGSWPLCTREVWEMHPLLLAGNDRIGVEIDRENPGADEAFEDYRQFTLRQAKRDPVHDTAMCISIVRLLPRLQKLTLGHVQMCSWRRRENVKYTRLRRRIWMPALYKDSIGAVASLVLPLLPQFPQIRDLTVHGPLDSFDLNNCGSFCTSRVKRLHLESLLVFPEAPSSVERFLRSFPDLEEVTMKFASNNEHAASLLQTIHWPRLRKLALQDTWTTADALIGLIDRHHALEEVTVRNTTLFVGTWRPVLEHVRTRHSHVHLECDGFLDTLDPYFSVNVSVYTDPGRLLRRFLSDEEFPWPFAL